MVIAFLGDIMLGRMVGKRYSVAPYDPVDAGLKDCIRESDYVIANLESPLATRSQSDGDHLSFQGNPDILREFGWVDCFSLANNHINDCGGGGMDETVMFLDRAGIAWNGLYREEYEPLIIDGKVAVVMFTDMMNVQFGDTGWKVLRMGDPDITRTITRYREKGFLVGVYAHVGLLFTRFPNPVVRDYLRSLADVGAGFIVTVHSHVLGGMEQYNGVPIFHSLGDFLMDGNSFRRRLSAILKLYIDDNMVVGYETVAAQTDASLKTMAPSKRLSGKMKRSTGYVSSVLACREGPEYERMFSRQYRREIMLHSISVLRFLFAVRGVKGVFKAIFLRLPEVGRMFRWMLADRSKDRRDDEAIKPDRKKMTQERLFG